MTGHLVEHAERVAGEGGGHAHDSRERAGEERRCSARKLELVDPHRGHHLEQRHGGRNRSHRERHEEAHANHTTNAAHLSERARQGNEERYIIPPVLAVMSRNAIHAMTASTGGMM